MTLLSMLSILWTLVRRVVRRWLCGPVVESWSWAVELRVVAIRAFLGASARDRKARWELVERFDPPIPRALRGLVQVEAGSVASIPGEWVTRVGFEDSTVLLYLHGGAYVGGSPATHRQFVSQLTWTLRTRTFVADYRLAPEHRFPAALDDAVAVYEALDAEVVLVAGDSAGGGLACALLLRIRDEGRRLPNGAILFSPYADLEHTAATIPINAPFDYLPLGDTEPNVAYLGDHDPKDPLASPMYGDYKGIPPLLVFAGGREMILEDATRLVEKARADGVDVSLHVEPDMMHVYPAIVPNHPAAKRTLAIADGFALRVSRPG
jgi:epsilon-lactone hydrolase